MSENAPSSIEIGDAHAPALPVLDEGVAPMDLSAIPNATLNDDGSITLVLDYPQTVNFGSVGQTGAQTASYESLTFRRLNGAQFLKLMRRPRMLEAGIAACTGLQEARLALLLDKLDTSDIFAMRAAFEQIMGGMGDGLPDQAEETPDGIKLPLRFPAPDGSGSVHHELVFHRMNGADLKAIEMAKDLVLPTRMARSTGLVLKAARELFDAMDAADAYDANRVARFLSSNGRKTGG